jgi:hypothetical protein
MNALLRRMTAFAVMMALPVSVVAGVDQPINPCAPQASCPNRGARDRTPPPPPPARPADCNAVCWGLILAVFIGSALVIKALTDKHLTSASDLDQNGPKFPERQGVGQFEAQGYVKAGWPIVVDYQSEPDTKTWIEIAPQDGHEKVTIELPSLGERSVQVITYNPERWGEGDMAVPARYSVHSADALGSDKIAEHSPLMVYGIGAGPRAVGSMTLLVTDFSPERTPQPDSIRFALKLLRPFNNSVVEVLRLPRQGSDKLDLVKAEARALPPVGPMSGTWNELRNTGKHAPGSGVYMLQSRAWRLGNSADDRDWTGAFAPNYVFVR